MKDKYGIENTKEWLDDFWTNKKNGYSLGFVGGWLIGIIFLLLMSSIIFLEKTFSFNISFNDHHWWILGAISYVICYFIVFKKDKYLQYFDEFEKWTVLEKKTNVLLSIGFIIFVVVFFFGSLLYFP